MKIKKQTEFPLFERYAEKFPVTPETIFAYDDTIYTNYDLPPDLIVHELTHLEQQKREGLENWVNLYLGDQEFRLKQEIEAYKKQVDSIKIPKLRLLVILESARHLSSELYGNIITYQEAKEILLK